MPCIHLSLHEHDTRPFTLSLEAVGRACCSGLAAGLETATACSRGSDGERHRKGRAEVKCDDDDFYDAEHGEDEGEPSLQAASVCEGTFAAWTGSTGLPAQDHHTRRRRRGEGRGRVAVEGPGGREGLEGWAHTQDGQVEGPPPRRRRRGGGGWNGEYRHSLGYP